MNNITTTQLNSYARLVDLSIRRFIGGRQDRKATSEVEANHSISAGQGGRFVKALIRPDYLKSVNQVASRIRENFYKFTLPWRGESRVLPISQFQAFTEAHNRLVDEFNRLADDFCARYDEIRNEAEVRLNGLFNADEYPSSSSDFRSRFEVTFDAEAFPRETDLNDPRLQARAQQAISARLADAHKQLLDRVADVVAHFGRTLANPKAIFRDSTITAISETIEEAEALNFTGNAEIAQALSDARKTLVAFNDPQILRDSKAVRKDAVVASQSVLNTLQSLQSSLGTQASA
jgi:hypothetical protein